MGKVLAGGYRANKMTRFVVSLVAAMSMAFAASAQEWVRARALPNGDLPEQVTDASQDPAMVSPWVQRWGAVATPLLWSHAMYLIAEAARAR